MNAFDPGFDALQSQIPIFPLTGVLLLPRGELPLNIFEPRYLHMIEDALGAGRMIGMIQPTEHENTQPNPPVYRTGCAGRIVAFQETDDGRFLLTLKGVCRFDVKEELPPKRGYRPVLADWARHRGDLNAGGDVRIDRARLLASLKSYFSAHSISADWNAIEASADERLVTCLSMICPFEASEKQALLEASNLLERSRILTTLVEMSVHGKTPGHAAPQ
jgi:hypothetical protein